MKRFAIDKFVPDFERTKFLDYRGKDLYLQGNRVFLEFWDTIGLEKVRNQAPPAPLARAQAIFIVYDITNYHSFEAVERWLSEVKAVGRVITSFTFRPKYLPQVAPPEVTLLLIGNKADLEPERAVPYVKAYELATSYNLVFYETSAKSGLNIEAIISNTTNHILNDSRGKNVLRKELIALNDNMKQEGKCYKR